MMDKLAIQAAEDFAHAGYPRDAAAILLFELDGSNAEVSEQVMRVREVLKHSGATEVRTAKDEAVPTLHRCAELGAMHVHHGQLAHPELERF